MKQNPKRTCDFCMGDTRQQMTDSQSMASWRKPALAPGSSKIASSDFPSTISPFDAASPAMPTDSAAAPLRRLSRASPIWRSTHFIDACEKDFSREVT